MHLWASALAPIGKWPLGGQTSNEIAVQRIVNTVGNCIRHITILLLIFVLTSACHKDDRGSVGADTTSHAITDASNDDRETAASISQSNVHKTAEGAPVGHSDILASARYSAAYDRRGNLIGLRLVSLGYGTRPLPLDMHPGDVVVSIAGIDLSSGGYHEKLLELYKGTLVMVVEVLRDGKRLRFVEPVRPTTEPWVPALPEIVPSGKSPIAPIKEGSLHKSEN